MCGRLASDGYGNRDDEVGAEDDVVVVEQGDKRIAVDL